MALAFPYPLAAFCDKLRIKTSQPFLKRNDERSGTGDGRVWSTTLARPLWSVSGRLADRTASQARELDALIDGLDGSSKTFLYAEPGYKGPASGVRTGLGGVQVASIRSDRGAIGLKGLPAGFSATIGDFLSIAYGGRIYFGRFAEGGTAGAGGTLAQIEIRPYLSLGVAVNDPIELLRPRFEAKIAPNGYDPFTYDLPQGEIARGGSITILQKI